MDRAPSAPPPRFSIHRFLGGGRVADLLMWRRRGASGSALAAATIAWVVFEYGGYGFLSLLADALLLLVAILFFWAKSALLLNRPLPPLPKMEVSDQMVEKVADKVTAWTNAVLSVFHDIAINGNKALFLKVVLTLYFVSYFGGFFDFITHIYIGFLLSMLLPALYNKYQDPIDIKLNLARDLLKSEGAFSKNGRAYGKEKKTY